VSLQDAWLAAWRFAAHAHNAQKLPGTDLPYLVHLGAVGMEILTAHGASPFARPELAVQCALLHDTLEDTQTPESDVLAAFGADVTRGVRALSKDAKLPKAEAMADSLHRIRQQPYEVWAVKLADRISNLGRPPSYWTAEKIASYAVEAQEILVALGEAHEPLARRLAERIAQYPRAA
jgi:(p)ppGpp synthase/HD superfamily hydrolase